MISCKKYYNIDWIGISLIKADASIAGAVFFLAGSNTILYFLNFIFF